MKRGKIVGVLVVAGIAVAYAIDFTSESDTQIGVRDWIFLGVILVVAAVFWWAEVLHTIGRPEGNTPAVAGLISSVIAAAGLLYFWTGVPLFVGAGGVVMGIEGYRRSQRGDERRFMALAAVVIGAITVAAWIPVFFLG
jgi:hypothetical protein